jgi:hypothetical protein
MPQPVPLVGSLVGTSAFTYKAFVDGSGRTVDGGTSYAFFLGTSLDDEPTKVKCSADEYAQVHSLGFGADVRVVAEMFAKRNRIEYRCVQLTIPAKA